MTVHPDDWETHWSLQGEVASRNPAQRYRHRLVREEVRKVAPDRLVDIGAGQGDLLEALHSAFPKVELSGVELSASGVASTRKKVPVADVRQFDLTSPSYAAFSEDFDCLTCVEVLEHLDSPDDFLKVALTHLRPGGVAVITVPSGPRTAFDVSIGHRDHFSPQRLRELMSEAGLTNIQIMRRGFPFFNLYRIMVFLRGKRLIEDVESAKIDTSRLASAVMATFGFLMRLNVSAVPLGWQIVASGSKPPN